MKVIVLAVLIVMMMGCGRFFYKDVCLEACRTDERNCKHDAVNAHTSEMINLRLDFCVSEFLMCVDVCHRNFPEQ